ncbi:hypothetical protein OF83DRAFT_622954 [Amylostereum chailletii]|nr:hypothetical protein OF83DRAFT_622954 [Amylostereum chailletii]
MMSLDIRIVVPLSSLPATIQIGQVVLAAAGPASSADGISTTQVPPTSTDGISTTQAPPTSGGPTQASGDKSSVAEPSSSTGVENSLGKPQTSSLIKPGKYVIQNKLTGNFLYLGDENKDTEITTDSRFPDPDSNTIPENAKVCARFSFGQFVGYFGLMMSSGSSDSSRTKRVTQ